MTVEEHKAELPEKVQKRLKQIRSVIPENDPVAEECILYGMHACRVIRKPLMIYVCFRNHIGFYTAPSGHSGFSTGFSSYRQGKGSVRLPLNESLPLDLMKRILKYRVSENNRSAGAKK